MEKKKWLNEIKLSESFSKLQTPHPNPTQWKKNKKKKGKKKLAALIENIKLIRNKINHDPESQKKIFEFTIESPILTLECPFLS